MAEQKQAPEETAELLQGELTKALADLDTEQAAHAVTKDELAKAKADLTEATAVIDGQAATIAEQDAKILTLQTSPAEFPSFVLSKKTYEVRVKVFQYKKVEYTVAELLKNKELQKELVEKEVGFIVEKEG